jgi:predicted site-specific integrase-resolvase
MSEQLGLNLPSNQTIFGVGEVSRITGISIGTITRYRKDGRVRPTTVLGKRFFYNTAALEMIRHIYAENMERLREKA